MLIWGKMWVNYKFDLGFVPCCLGTMHREIWWYRFDLCMDVDLGKVRVITKIGFLTRFLRKKANELGMRTTQSGI